MITRELDILNPSSCYLENHILETRKERAMGRKSLGGLEKEEKT